MAFQSEEPRSTAPDPASVLVSLAAHCVKGLGADHLLVFRARMLHGGVRDAAAAIGYSETQLRRRWDQLKELVLTPLGLADHDDLLDGYYGTYHYWDQLIGFGSPYPGCSGSRELQYYTYVDTNNNIDELRSDFLRVWVCGTLVFNNGPQYQYNWHHLLDWAGYTASNTCGLQADTNSYWHSTGLFWDSHYLNY